MYQCTVFLQGRGHKSIRGNIEGPAVMLWDYMSPEERRQQRKASSDRDDWILVHRKRKSQSAMVTDDLPPPGTIWHTLKRGGTTKELRKTKTSL